MIKKKYNFIGTRFGKGVVIDEMGFETVGKDKKYPRQFQLWKLKCDCGNEYISSSRYLLYDQGKHCGCLLKQDLIGKRFGSAIVTKYIGHKVRGNKSSRSVNVWELQCNCGKTFQTYTEYLTSGMTTSCGCQRSYFHTRHCKKSFSIYFKNIKGDARRRNRVFSLTQDQLKDLIKSQSYKCKLSDIPISFDDGSASLDRIDNNKDYEITNVQWVHRKINYMKNILDQTEFISLCKKVSTFNV